MFYYQNSVCCIWYLGVCSTVQVCGVRSICLLECLLLNWQNVGFQFQFCVVLVFKVAVVLLPASNEATKKC
jgi:hypothetical protein